MRDPWLLAGGAMSGIAAVLHLGCIAGGPSWYRFFGAGEGIARLAERGSPKPALIAIGIAAVLIVWAAYGFSGAGVIPRLPLLRTGLIAIAAIYLLRAAMLPLMLARMPDRGAAFLVWSSLIVLVLGLAYAIGTVTAWSRLAPAH